jgi:hypothetical protein
VVGALVLLGISWLLVQTSAHSSESSRAPRSRYGR